MNVGIDIGGTFTDLIFLEEGSDRFFMGKVLTTPKDPSLGAIQGLTELLKELSIRAGALNNIIHGTTLVANAIIERRGAKTGLITTKGFRDTLEIGRERRYDIYDIFLEMPEPLAPRYLRKEVSERVAYDGTILIELNEEEARGAVRELTAEGVESIAVAFLHSFRNPENELKMRRIIEGEAPEVFVSLSHEVMPEIREYERTSTTAANAYTQPLMKRYLAQLSKELSRLGFKGHFFMMLSSGGITNPGTAERFPVRVVESGPAAGAIAASFFGKLIGARKILSFDMGGTTAKACLISDGKPMVTTDFEVARIYRFKKGSGIPIKPPVIDMIEIGAGGGSIAYVDSMGLLKVGPQSAGADPGPACYNLGGTEATVTDADLLLGYLDPVFFLGGKMALDKGRAERAIRHRLAQPLGVDVIKAAWGVHQVVNENMANAARIHAVDKGEDLKSYVMVAFGGAGPVHAYGVCPRLGIKRFVCPLGAGVISALGFLVAPISFDLVRSYLLSLDEVDVEALNDIFGDMEREATQLLVSAGVGRQEITYTRSCDMRYQGQGHEISVPIPSGTLKGEHLRVIQESFDREYTRLYHRTIPGAREEGLNWRLLASGPDPRVNLKREMERTSPETALKGTRPVYFAEAGDFVETKVYDRYRLAPNATIEGPAVIEERESTAVLSPNCYATIDAFLNLVVEMS